MKATYKSYPSNLTIEQWAFIAPYLPVAKSGGRPRRTDLQAVINAIFYVLCSGCSWRMLLDAVASSRGTRPTRCIATR